MKWLKFTKILPYLLCGTMTMMSAKGIDANKTKDSWSMNDAWRAKTAVDINKLAQDQENAKAENLENKAKQLCDTYIDFVLQGQQNIKQNKSKQKRRAAVLDELPGAPVGRHCMFGQYTQLNRAMRELQDTLSIIPFQGRNSCARFSYEMTKKYGNPEYAGAIRNGQMMNPGAYKSALQAFLKLNHVTDQTPDDVKQQVVARFEKNHFSIESLHPGTILIVPRSAHSNGKHAIVFLGRGRVRDGKFTPDENGAFMYAGYNNESVGDIFRSFDTHNVFAADIYNISLASYENEFENVENMNYSDLYTFVYETPKQSYDIAPKTNELKAMAYEKYFAKRKFKPKHKSFYAKMASAKMASAKIAPSYLLAKAR